MSIEMIDRILGFSRFYGKIVSIEIHHGHVFALYDTGVDFWMKDVSVNL